MPYAELGFRVDIGFSDFSDFSGFFLLAGFFRFSWSFVGFSVFFFVSRASVRPVKPESPVKSIP